jgi:hypothetical protein
MLQAGGSASWVFKSVPIPPFPNGGERGISIRKTAIQLHVIRPVKHGSKRWTRAHSHGHQVIPGHQWCGLNAFRVQGGQVGVHRGYHRVVLGPENCHGTRKSGRGR